MTIKLNSISGVFRCTGWVSNAYALLVPLKAEAQRKHLSQEPCCIQLWL